MELILNVKMVNIVNFFILKIKLKYFFIFLLNIKCDEWIAKAESKTYYDEK